jgi:hypothetical protein
LVSEAEQRLGLALKWEDNGPVVHAEQAWWGFVALQTFAKWIDYRDLFPSLEPPPEDSFYKHPIYLLKEPRRPFTYPHLIDHSCYSGYLLPCAFNEVLAVEPHQVYHWTFFHSLGSAPTMYEELERLEKMVYEPTIRSHVVSSSDLELIDAGFNTLREVTKKSLESSLPVIFYG